MTPNQKSVLTWTRRERIRQIWFEARWIQPADFSAVPGLADRFLAAGENGLLTKMVRWSNEKNQQS